MTQTGQVSQAQADEYLRDAVRMSSEGILLEPSQKGLNNLDRLRFGEIAQELRRPAAVCFVERAIQTMARGEVDGEQGWLDVPEGQLKIRLRAAVDGTVMSSEVLDSGFVDEHMETCLREVFAKQRFPESRDGFAYYIDVYYWVSLGLFREANSEVFADRMRRQQVAAGLRAKPCVSGRVPPGRYTVTALNLFARDGSTVVNRVDRGSFDPEIEACVARAFRGISIHSEPDAFIRPAMATVTFEVREDGTVGVDDERWLELIELEEQAERERKKAELLGVPIGADRPEPDVMELPTGGGEVVEGADEGADAGEGEIVIPPATLNLGPSKPDAAKPDAAKPDAAKPDAAKPDKPGDPSKPGVKIDLSPRRRP